MTAIIQTLLRTILPILLLVGAGSLLQSRFDLDVRSLSRVSLYVLTPCLGFSTISASRMSHTELAQMAGVSALVALSMVLVGLAVARALRLDLRRRSALQLVLAFSNSGNFGLSVCLFAFGEAGLERGLIFFITSSILTNSLGVYLASRGGSGGSVRASLRNMLAMPLLYAAALGLLFSLAGWPVPEALQRATEAAGKAAVPVMLLVLGMQLTRTRLGHELRLVGIGTVLKLIVAPLFALGFSALLHLTGISWQVALIEAAMPTAVTTAIISEEFDASPAFVSSMVLVSTVASLITLTVLLSLVS